MIQKLFLILALLINTNSLYGYNPDDELPLRLNIISVPDYVFASATYATPIKFEIVVANSESYNIKAEIHNIQVAFEYEGKSKIEKSLSFMANDGPSINNGSSNVYTAIVRPDFYAELYCADHKTNQAQFRLKVDVTPFINGVKYSRRNLESGLSSGKIKKAYADKRVFCIEFPVHVHESREYKNISTGILQKANIEKPGQIEFHQLKPYLAKQNNVVPNFTVFSDFVYPNASKVNNSTAMHSECSLFCNASNNSSTMWRAQTCGVRTGASVFLSYAGKKVDFDVHDGIVMDLAANISSFQVEYFQGKYEVVRNTTIKEARNNRFNFATAAAGFFQIASALAVVSGPAAPGVIAAGATWSLTFGTLSGVFGILSSVSDVDNELVEPFVASDASAILGYQKSWINEFGQGISVPFLLSEESNGNQNVIANAVIAGVAPGDQYTFVVQVDSGVTLESLASNAFGYSEATAKASVICNTGKNFDEITFRTQK